MSSTGTLAPGTLVAGRYQVQEPLAGEGSAAVYRAEDTRLDRPVALRALPAAEAGGAQQGKAAARLVHPNVARVLDFGTDTEQALEFVVADLGTGGSLAALLAQRGVPPLPLALRMVQEAAAGLAAAHRAGLVHGDLHPGVLWLSRDEGRLQVRVLGLGLNPVGSPPPRATARYAAPERLRRSRELTAATDVFSLGVIAHEVFAGLPADWTQLLVQMARGQAVVAPSLLEARPELPAHVAHAVRRALMSDPASRWPDAGELAAHLIADLAGQPVEAPAAVPAPAAAEPRQTAAEMTQGTVAERLVAAIGADDEQDSDSVTLPESDAATASAEAAPSDDSTPDFLQSDPEPVADAVPTVAAATDSDDSTPDFLQPVADAVPAVAEAAQSDDSTPDFLQPDAGPVADAVPAVATVAPADDSTPDFLQPDAEPVADEALAVAVSEAASDFVQESAPIIVAETQVVATEPEPVTVATETAPIAIVEAPPAVVVIDTAPAPEPAPVVAETTPIAIVEAPPAVVSEPGPVAAEAAPVQSPPAEPTVAETAAEPAQAEAPKPSRQPLTAGRRGKPIALASTDLADTLYIPPTLEKPRVDPAASRPAASAEKPAPVPVTPPIVAPPAPIASAPVAPKPEATPEPIAAAPTLEPLPVAAASQPEKPAPVVASKSEPKPEPTVAVSKPEPAKPEVKVETKPEPVAAPVIALRPETPTRAADETLAAAAFVAAPMPRPAPAASAPADGTAPIPFPERRRNGLARLGEKPSSGHKRGLIAASIAVAVLVGGGVVAKTLLARPGIATPQVAQNLTSQAAASLGTAPSAAQPEVAVADSAAAVAPIVVPPLTPADTAGLSAAEKQKQEEDRRRLEEQRRLQQRQQDSIRQARLAAAAAQPVAPAPQPVALQNAPRPTPGVPAPQMEQRPVAPAASAPPPAPAAAPARPAADPNRVYSAEELDSSPSLANAPAFRSAVSRSYPAALEGTNTWGSAVVSFVVRPDGSVDRASISVVEASHPAFRGAATAAISRARFTPARVGGQAVRTQVSMPITWRAGAQDDD